MQHRVDDREDARIVLVQLPFPSQEDPLPTLAAYYEQYGKRYSRLFREYAVRAGDLWETPLWVAHLDGALREHRTSFVDLSGVAFDVERCADRIAAHGAAAAGPLVFLSPLAQNFALAIEVSRRLMARGLRTVVGGNMADLASPEDFTHIYTGLVKPGLYEELTRGPGEPPATLRKLGRSKQPLGYRPSYRHLEGFGDRVPLVRLHASHGCLFACSFCGDAWSRQLHLVSPELLTAEIDEIRRVFPNTRLLYIGDKTFGQSPEAVENLRRALLPEYGFRLIVQTHVSTVTPALADTMVALGVEVVELGFETASSMVLEELRKHGGAREYQDAITLLHARGLHVVLNVLGGLPNETRQSQQETLEFMAETADQVWLYNLYNFVPYPKTPLFASLRSRIVDWDFQHWREDRPVVYEPYHQTRGQAWDHFLQLVELATRLVARAEGGV
ncbi:MAG: radical SAM protein [Kofleriaceae bacterium]